MPRVSSANPFANPRRMCRRKRLRSRVTTAVVLVLTLLAMVFTTIARGEMVMSTDEVALVTQTTHGELVGLGLRDIIAKHVAFPREVRARDALS